MKLEQLAVLILAPLVALANPTAKDAPSTQSKTIYVATNGNDAWSGRLIAPNPTKTDGPLASLPTAIERARQLKGDAGAATMVLRNGSYPLRAPLVLTPQDSGLILAGYRAERPVISAGRQIGGWKEISRDGKKVWTTQVAEAADHKWVFRELWINGKRAVRARYPNEGYLKIESLPDATPEWNQGQTRFRYAQGDLKAWDTLTNAEVVAMTRWVESRLPVLRLDESNRIISFIKRSVFQLGPGDPYYLEGAFEHLDQPGEWYLDPNAGLLSYLPRPGEKLEQLEAVAPVHTQVIRLEGRPDKAEFVERVIFRDLTFSHAEWTLGDQMSGFSQAAIGVPGAVWGEGAHQCVFDHCAFRNLGNYGLELGRGSQSNQIVGCQFIDLGAGAVKIGETAIRDKPEDRSYGNVIRGCDISAGGKLFASAIGIWIGQSSDNQITRNLIHDFFYTGISIGWTWGYGPSLATNNLVALNHVHHIGVKSDGDGPILSDMGGIYTLGKQPGTRVINNLWHDIGAIRYGGWGIYFDEGSSGIVASSNIVYRTTHGGFHQHYGETNVIRNNIFAFARDHQLQRTRLEPHSSFTFETNIVYFDSGPLLTGDWSDNHFVMDRNLYFDARSDASLANFRLGPASFEKWRERGHDRHSVIIDPQFENPKKGDFRFRTNSAAKQIDFQPIDLSQVP